MKEDRSRITPESLMRMRDVTETVTFWVLVALAFAALVIFDSPVWILHTMFASANVGAKCVRAENRTRSPT